MQARMEGVVNRWIWVICFSLVSIHAHAVEMNKDYFKGYTAAFVLQNRTTGEVVDLDPQQSAKAFAPCSTFKIYNTLIGLELGLIKGADDPWYTWDGVKRSIDEWNQNLTLRQAIRVSAVPAYQILAREIGVKRMKQYIDLIDYGTKDISSGIDQFWLIRPGAKSIEISALKQVALLNELLDGKLPFSSKNIAILKDILKYEKTDKGTLYGKTGSAFDEQDKGILGWYVGFLESKGVVYVFACNITGGENPSGKTARGIVEEIFKAHGLL
jgi:beta-lactamase class D